MSTTPRQKDDGQTHADQQDGGERDTPRTPNEHDTSADSQAAAQANGNEVGKAAHDDATSGRQDTDRGPVTDRVYNDKVRDGSPKEGPRR